MHRAARSGPLSFANPSQMPVDIPVSSRALPQAADATEASGPEAIYRERCREGLIRPDPAQEHAVARLQQLHEALRQYQPESGRLGWVARLGPRGQEGGPPQRAS